MNSKYEDGKYQQHVDDMIVRREVLCCQTMLVEGLLHIDFDGFTIEDYIQPYYELNGEEMSESERDDYIRILEDDIAGLDYDLRDMEGSYEYDELHDTMLKEMQDRLDEANDAEPEYPEIYEWWLVREWFAKRLQEHGQVILDNDYGTWWGRQTTGQAIHLDKVICDIHDKFFHEWNKENGYDNQ